MSVAPQALVGTFVADPAHSSLQFAVKHMKVATYRAAFEDVTATIVGDEHGLRMEGSSRAESITIKTPADFRNHVLYQPEFFDASRFETIDFRSTRAALDGDGAVTLEGELTIRGVTKPVSATGTYEPPVEDPFGNVRAALELRTTIDRRDWGMTWQQPLPKGGDVLAWDVELTVFLALLKQD